MTRYEVVLTAGAERDLEAIYDYIAEFDSAARADHVLERLLRVAQSLSMLPQSVRTRANCLRWASASTDRASSNRTA